MNNNDLNAIPRGACTLRAEFAHVGDNGEKAKTAPVKLLARSSQPIEHHWWGLVAHDLTGFNLNGRNRIPIDFDHDTGEAIGYLNKFEVEEDGLYASGAIVSTQEGDRASRILAQMREGIPYEASINFGGDGIEVERVPSGKLTQVNGYELAGEATVVRKWPLRGVAVTLYGYDSQTKTSLLSNGGTVAAKVITPTEEGDMTDPKELNAEGAEPVEAVSAAAEEVATPKADEATELAKTVEVEQPEAELSAVEGNAAEVEEVEPDYQFSAKEFANLVTEFGAEVAAATVTNGGNYTDALRLAFEARGERIAELEKKVSELSAKPRTASSAVAFADGEQSKNKRLSLASKLQQKFEEVKKNG